MMQPQKAKRIFNEFEAVLKTEGKIYGMVMSESSLPYSRVDIKDALKSYATWLHQENRLDAEVAADLKTAYGALGMFVSQANADFIKAYKDSLGKPATTGQVEKNKQFQFIMNKAHNQEEDYIQDYKVFYSRLVKHGDPEGREE